MSTKTFRLSHATAVSEVCPTMNPARRRYNNPGIHEAGLASNRRRAVAHGARQSELARQALTVLQARGDLYTHWEAVLRHRADHPTYSLRELADTITPPMTKSAYAAQLRRALRAAGATP
jgi:hypothetical protein